MQQNTQQNINLIRRLYDEVYSKGNMAICDELIATNLRLNDPAIHGKDGFKGFKESETEYHRAFPNKKAKIDDIFAFDDKVLVRWTCEGIHKGSLQGISPTNKNVKVTGISLYRFTNGKVTEIWQSWDRLGLLEQIGEVQPAHALH